MKLGDKVEWTSQAGGVVAMKMGNIVLVIPANTPLQNEMLRNSDLGLQELRWEFSDPSKSRSHESYLVQVEDRLYWPRVSGLRLSFNGTFIGKAV